MILMYSLLTFSEEMCC